MTPEQMVEIRRRDAEWARDPAHHGSRGGPSADRHALVQELDRVRDLWEQCRNNCFDKTVLLDDPGSPGSSERKP